MNKELDNLPEHASVVVVGGGIMGCSTLYHLAKSGITDAILVERNQLTSGTTWHSAAQVRALRSTRNLTDLIRYSIDLYSALEKETGQATGWINKGSLSIATNKDRLAHIRRQESLAHLYGLRANSVNIDEVSERWPLMNTEDVIGAVWSPDDGRVSPSDVCAALVKGAKDRGARLYENTAVKAIFTKDGRVAGVETSRGRIQCDAIAVCTGLWSRQVAALANVDVPVYPCEHFYLLTKPVAGITGNLPTLSDHDSHLYIRDDSGGLLVGCFEPQGKPIAPERLGEDFSFQLLPEDWDHFEPMMNNALHRLPCLADAEVKMLLNGPESFTPDGSFLLGEAAETRGLFLGCGMNSVGVATGGGAGMALAHCIQHGHTPMDLSEADPKRFAPCFNSARLLAARVPQVLGEHYAIHYPGDQWNTARDLRHTKAHDLWESHNAHFGQFYGWERPLYFDKKREPVLTMKKPDWFDQVAIEVNNAHTKAALFDASTFGKIEVTGPDSEAFLNRVCANDMAREPGRAIYTAMLNERGGYESDLTALRISDETYHLYTSSAAIKKDLAWCRRHLKPKERAELTDITEDKCVYALMGPDAAAIVQSLGADNLQEPGFFRHVVTTVAGIEVRATRLSYVGEPGWEITCESSQARTLAQALLEAGAKPAGLFAQSSMRIEKRFLAWGHDLDTDITPLNAGLIQTVDFSTDFTGRDALMALQQESINSMIATMILDDTDAIPLGNEPIYVDNEIVGKSTSASFGYRVGKPVALLLLKNVEAISAIEGGKTIDVQIDIAGEKFSGSAFSGPAYQS